MATAFTTSIAPATQGWTEHHGWFVPLPAGTLAKIMLFNGDVETILVGHEDRHCWFHFDGQSKGLKARRYRVVTPADLSADRAPIHSAACEAEYA